MEKYDRFRIVMGIEAMLLYLAGDHSADGGCHVAMTKAAAQRTGGQGRAMLRWLLAGTAFMAGVAHARPDAPHTAAAAVLPAEDTTDLRQDGDIIVTAQKRAENVRNVPLAISAFSGDTLAKANVSQVFDLQRLAPSLRIDLGPRADKARVVIRGIGSSGGTAIEPSVATFVDGVYFPREGATFATYLDIEAVEILRGPQGTLFGRNASVGAISLHTGTPRFENRGHLRAEVGTGNRIKLDGYVNLAASDSVAIRIAGLGEVFEGLYKNRLTGDRVGGVNTFAGRLSAKFLLSDNVENTFRATYSRRKDNDYYTPQVIMPDTFPAGGLKTYLDRFASVGSKNLDLDPFDTKINQFLDERLDEHQVTLSNELAFTTASDFQIKLISGFNQWRIHQRGNQIFNAETPTLVQYQFTKSKSHQQELQLITPEDFIVPGLSGVFGAFYFHEKLAIDEDFQFKPDLCKIALIALPVYASCLANSDIHATNVEFDQNLRSLAAYGQITYKLADTLDLTLGTRWTRDKKHALLDAKPLQPAGALLTATEKTSLSLAQSRVTYRANLTWRPTKDAMLFASYASGYKSGGVNSAFSNVILGQKRLLKPETVNNYEIGVKTSWLDDALRLDAVVYQMDVKNFQDRSFNGLAFAVNNAGGIRNRGVEFDYNIRPTDWFRLSGGLAYLDSKFTSYLEASNLPGLPGTQNLKGTRPTFASKWSGAVGAELLGEVGSGLDWSLRGDLSFTSKANINAINDNNPATVQSGYSLLSARATISAGDLWSLSVFGANLTDKGYCTSYAYQPLGALVGGQAPGIAALRCTVVGTPRTIGISGSVGF